ncbi:MAG: NAD(P)-dependent oxidoreductase, partial [Hafnia sp.]
RQLREYHHVTDDAAAIRMLVDRSASGVVELSHGHPITLRSLAETIFESAGKTHLLRLGALPEPDQENFTQVFLRPAALKDVVFRETLAGVSKYMKTLIEE